MTAEEYIERLLELNKKKHRLLQNMSQSLLEQANSIQQENPVQLNEKLVQNQKMIEEIDQLDSQFGVYFQRMKQELKVNSLDELQNPNMKGFKELKESTADIVSLLQKISSQEAENQEKAKKLLNSLGSEIKKLNQGKKMLSSYKPTAGVQPPSFYFDKKK